MGCLVVLLGFGSEIALYFVAQSIGGTLALTIATVMGLLCVLAVGALLVRLEH